MNNSGVMYNQIIPPSPDDDIKTFQEKLWNSGTPEEFTRTFEVNVTAVYYTTVAFLELLDAGNKRPEKQPGAPTSQVVTTSSIGAFRRDENTFSMSYNASKAAVLHLGKILANTFKRWQIRSNIIAPGLFPSGNCIVSILYRIITLESFVNRNDTESYQHEQCCFFRAGPTGPIRTSRRYWRIDSFPR